MASGLQVLQKLRSGLSVNDIESYIATGDRNALAQFKLRPKNTREAHLVAEVLSHPSTLTEEGGRALHVLVLLRRSDLVAQWLDNAITQEKLEDDYHAIMREALSCNGIERCDLVTITAGMRSLVTHEHPSSAGRFLLSLSDDDLRDAFKKSCERHNALNLVEFLLDHAQDRMLPLLDVVLRHHQYCVGVAELLLTKAGRRFEDPVLAAFQSAIVPWQRFGIGRTLVKLDPDQYHDVILEEARRLIRDSAQHRHSVADGMLEVFGMEVLPDIVAYLADGNNTYWNRHILTKAVAKWAKDALPAVEVVLASPDNSQLRLEATSHLISLTTGSHDELIRSSLESCLGEKQPNDVIQAIGLIPRWKLHPLSEQLWALLSHKSSPVRAAAARTLGKLGDEAIPRATALLEDKKADTRQAAVTLLASINSPKSLAVLEKRVDEEANDDVRDAILLALEAAWEASGRKITRKDIDARIARTAPKFKELPAAWIKEAKLPPLKYKKGGPLDKEAVRYLLYRQSRAKEIRPDVEAKPLYALIDRKTSADFALEILKGFLASKAEAGDRWALTVSCLLGDDRIVPLLSQKIKEWADSARGKIAEHAVQALALLGTDAALLTIDFLAIRYRSKYKNIGKAAVEAFAAAAEQLGITPDELGDRVVPWLGFEPGKPRIIDCGKSKVEVRIGLDLKLKYHDLDKNKPIASLPKSASKEEQAEIKELGANLREAVKAQLLRLENLMVRQQRWPAARWRELFLSHPLLLPFAARLVWGIYAADGKLTGTCRALEDRTLTDAADEPVKLPADCSLGIVHPLELSDAERTAWQTHLSDYEIEPPFAQLDRPVVRLPDDKRDVRILKDHTGTDINAMTFKGRAERLGWVRGSVCDGGGITSYWKSFPTAGTDVFLGLDGMYIGIDMNSSIKLQDAYFVRSGTVKTGSYTYDEPGDKDERILPFAAVPPIVYSEVMGDLQKIAGSKSDGREEES